MREIAETSREKLGPFRLETPEETREFGRLLGQALRPGDTVCLSGDLGAGKTTLTQGIATGLQVSGPVTSPTFTLVHEHPGAVPLFHVDAYRLGSADELWDLGFEEYLRAGGVIVVEWGERVAEALPEDRITVTLESDGDARLARIQASGSGGERLARAVHRAWEGRAKS